MQVVQVILSVLGAIQTLLPLLTASGGSAAPGAITSIITALQKFLPMLEQLAPLIGDEATLIYAGVKNILSNIRGADTDAQQDADLDALDARVDAAWAKIAPDFDPDAPKAA